MFCAKISTFTVDTKGLVFNYGEGGATKWENRGSNQLPGGGGDYKTGRGAREVLPLRNEGPEKVLAMLKGEGHNKFWARDFPIL